MTNPKVDPNMFELVVGRDRELLLRCPACQWQTSLPRTQNGAVNVYIPSQAAWSHTRCADE